MSSTTQTSGPFTVRWPRVVARWSPASSQAVGHGVTVEVGSAMVLTDHEHEDCAGVHITVHGAWDAVGASIHADLAAWLVDLLSGRVELRERALRERLEVVLSAWADGMVGGARLTRQETSSKTDALLERCATELADALDVEVTL